MKGKFELRSILKIKYIYYLPTYFNIICLGKYYWHMLSIFRIRKKINIRTFLFDSLDSSRSINNTEIRSKRIID